MFIGTLYPLALESLTGAKISVGPPYFNLTFGPLMLPLLLAMPFGPYLAWKRGDLAGAAQRLFAAALAGARSALVVAFALLLARAVAGAVRHRARRLDHRRRGLRMGHAREAVRGRRATKIWRRARGLPRSAYGTTLAHAGIGLSVLGIVATSAWQSEQRRHHEAGRHAPRSPATSSPSAASPRRRAPTTRSRSASSP